MVQKTFYPLIVKIPRTLNPPFIEHGKFSWLGSIRFKTGGNETLYEIKKKERSLRESEASNSSIISSSLLEDELYQSQLQSRLSQLDQLEGEDRFDPQFMYDSQPYRPIEPPLLNENLLNQNMWKNKENGIFNSLNRSSERKANLSLKVANDDETEKRTSFLHSETARINSSNQNQKLSSSNSIEKNSFIESENTHSSPSLLQLNQVSTTGKLYPSIIGLLTKCGKCQDTILASVNRKLKLRYQIDNPIQIAIDAIKPVIQYKVILSKKAGLPKVLSEHKRNNIALKWLVEAASNKKYAMKKDLERGLYDEVVSIFSGTSTLYAKRFQMHKST